MSKLKSSSSGWAKRQTRGRFAWQSRFAAFTVSESQVERVRHYIRTQEEHHGRHSFQDEFELMLKANRIDLTSFTCGVDSVANFAGSMSLNDGVRRLASLASG